MELVQIAHIVTMKLILKLMLMRFTCKTRIIICLPLPKQYLSRMPTTIEIIAVTDNKKACNPAKP